MSDLVARYRGRSEVRVDVDDAVLGLATNALRPEGYLCGSLDRVDVVRDALLTLHDVVHDVAPAVASDAASDVAAGHEAPARAVDDIVVTVTPEQIHLEGVDASARRHVRVSVRRALLEATRDVVEGTTTVPFPRELSRTLQRLHRQRRTLWRIAPGGVEAHVDGSVVAEHTRSLGDAWLRHATRLLQSLAAPPRSVASTTLVPPLRAAHRGATDVIVDGVDAALLLPLGRLLVRCETVVVHDDDAVARWWFDLGGVTVTFATHKRAARANPDDAAADDGALDDGALDEDAHALRAALDDLRSGKDIARGSLARLIACGHAVVDGPHERPRARPWLAADLTLDEARRACTQRRGASGLAGGEAR